MNWKGKELKTFGDTLDAVTGCKTREEAQEFMRLYRAECPYADENIGYGSGYLDRDDMVRVQDWFGVAHPIFGRSQPTPEEAFAMGQKYGDELKARRDGQS